MNRESLAHRIYDINDEQFESVAKDVWIYQYLNNPVYHSFCRMLGIHEPQVQDLSEIPFMPVMMFREHDIMTHQWVPETVFHSSGTTQIARSKHHVRSLSWYHSISRLCFSSFFGKPEQYAWIALLPSYIERTDSSLVEMVVSFMNSSHHPENAFYSVFTDDMLVAMKNLQRKNTPTILIGVSFALLDFFDQHDIPVWENLTVIETGGMKGRGPEMTRDELCQRLNKQHKNFRLSSEYGMTELLSQAYRTNDYFQPGPTMRVFVRDISDPMMLIGHDQRGVINIIDLGNLDTCSFIATDDIGITFGNGGFEVLGRLDYSDLRGCNLMYTSGG